MTSDPKTRKPVNEITLQDLIDFPVWEYAIDEEGLDGQDETWIRPVNRKTVPRNSYSQIVSTQFTTRSGLELGGFMIVSTAAKPMDFQPGAVICNRGYFCLPVLGREAAIKEDARWNIESRDELIGALASKEIDVFPIRYQLRAMLSGEKALREGQID